MRVSIDNVTSVISGSRSDLETLRHGVSYQKKDMLPIEGQRIVKDFFKSRRRYGTRSDLDRIWSDEETRKKLNDMGVTDEDLPPKKFEATLRQRNIWDGWVRMISSSGRFQTGLLSEVVRQARLRCGSDVDLIDNRGQAPWGDVSFSEPSLWDYQREARTSFLDIGRGVIDLPPRSGKTRIGVSVVSKIGVPTLWITPAIGIAKQTCAEFEQHLPGVAHFQSGKPNKVERRKINRSMVVIATPATAITLPNLHSRKALVIDEFHHSAAETWQTVSQACVGAYWRLGLTGTHCRADGRGMEMAGVLGGSVFRRTVSDLVASGRLVPARIVMVRLDCDPIQSSAKDCYRDGIVDHAGRNQILSHAAIDLSKKGRRVLVLVKWIAHAEILTRLIPGSVQVDGRDNDLVDRRLQQLARGEISVVVGTSVIGEGRDVPVADALVYAAGGKSRVKVKQDFFRVLTPMVGKTEGVIVDVVDTHHPQLFDHSVQRLHLYRDEGCFESAVYSKFNFLKGTG